MARTVHVEKHFTSGNFVRDMVIGMSDGLTVPFALAAGLSGAVANTRLIVIGGLAEIAAGSIAMGLGGYLAAKGDADAFQALDRQYRANPVVVRERLHRDSVEHAIGTAGKVRWVPPPVGGSYHGFHITLSAPVAGSPMAAPRAAVPVQRRSLPRPLSHLIRAFGHTQTQAPSHLAGALRMTTTNERTGTSIHQCCLVCCRACVACCRAGR